MVKVCALASDGLVLLGQQTDSFLSPVATLDAPGHLMLRGCQSPFSFPQPSRILNRFSGRERGEVLKPNIDAHAIACLRQVTRLVFYDSEDYIPTVSFPLDRASFNLTLDRTGEMHPTASKLRKTQLIAFKLKSGLWEGERIVTLTATEAGESRFLSFFHSAKEILESPLKASQRLLQHLAMDTRNIFPTCFDLWQLIGLISDREAFSGHPVGVAALLKPSVVKFAANRQPVKKNSFYFVTYFQFVLVGFHNSDYTIITRASIHRSIVVFILIIQSAGALTVSAPRLLRLLSASRKRETPRMLAATMTVLILAVNDA